MVYSTSLSKHVTHLRSILEVLDLNKLYAKRSSKFACNEVEYLGYVITSARVHTGPKKIATMQQWSTPTDLKSLREFLGLTGYYRKFVKGYGQIAAPLTTLLKNDAFSWSKESKQAFQHLKAAMVQPPMLALPNFDKTFVKECDALRKRLGAVLM